MLSLYNCCSICRSISRPEDLRNAFAVIIYPIHNGIGAGPTDDARDAPRYPLEFPPINGVCDRLNSRA